MRKNNIINKKILITGANGFVGINLVNKLKKMLGTVSSGKCPSIFAIVEPGSEVKFIKGIKYEFIDITDDKNIKKYVLETNPDIIIHLAAYINNENSKKNILKSTRINVGGTLNLLDAASFLAVKPFFVFISTGEVYGNLDKKFFSESDIPKPASVYSVTKLSAEDICEKYKSVFDIPVLIVRPSVIYGQYQREGMFIPSIILSLLKNKNFNMTGGKQLRDFIYIDDFLDALISLVKSKQEGIFNISSGKSCFLKNLAFKIKKFIKTDAKVNIGQLPYRENEIWHYKLSNYKLKKTTAWMPKYRHDHALKKTIAWYKKFYAI